MAKSKYKPDDIVWAIVEDRNGVKKPVPRPLLVVHPHPINTDQQLVCICISTDPKNDPQDPSFELPWNAETGSTTGLFRWSAAVLLWRVLLDQNAVMDRTGRVPEATLTALIEARERALHFKSSGG